MTPWISWYPVLVTKDTLIIGTDTFRIEEKLELWCGEITDGKQNNNSMDIIKLDYEATAETQQLWRMYCHQLLCIKSFLTDVFHVIYTTVPVDSITAIGSHHSPTTAADQVIILNDWQNVLGKT